MGKGPLYPLFRLRFGLNGMFQFARRYFYRGFRFARRYFCRGFFGVSVCTFLLLRIFRTLQFARRYFYRGFQIARRCFCRGSSGVSVCTFFLRIVRTLRFARRYFHHGFQFARCYFSHGCFSVHDVPCRNVHIDDVLTQGDGMDWDDLNERNGKAEKYRTQCTEGASPGYRREHWRGHRRHRRGHRRGGDRSL